MQINLSMNTKVIMAMNWVMNMSLAIRNTVIDQNGRFTVMDTSCQTMVMGTNPTTNSTMVMGTNPTTNPTTNSTMGMGTNPTTNSTMGMGTNPTTNSTMVMGTNSTINPTIFMGTISTINPITLMDTNLTTFMDMVMTTVMSMCMKIRLAIVTRAAMIMKNIKVMNMMTMEMIWILDVIFKTIMSIRVNIMDLDTIKDIHMVTSMSMAMEESLYMDMMIIKVAHE